MITDAGFTKLHEASDTHLASIRGLFEERFSGAELDTLGELLGRLPSTAPDATDCSVPD